MTIRTWEWLELREYQRQHAERRQSISSNEHETVEQYSRGCLEDAGTLLGVAKCAIASVDANREAQRFKYDLPAQQEMAEWAFVLVVLTVAQVTIGLVGIVSLVYSLQWASDANANMLKPIDQERENAHRQMRAYMLVQSDVLENGL